MVEEHEGKSVDDQTYCWLRRESKEETESGSEEDDAEEGDKVEDEEDLTAVKEENERDNVTRPEVEVEGGMMSSCVGDAGETRREQNCISWGVEEGKVECVVEETTRSVVSRAA